VVLSEPIVPGRALPGSAARSSRWILLALIFLFTIPPLAEAPDVGLDPSWKLGLHLVRERGMVLGRDLFFTYGPWGFLSVPLTLTLSLWLEAVAYCLAVQVALFAAVGVWIHRRLEGWASYVPPLSLALFAPASEYHVLLALLLWVYLAMTSEPKGRPVRIALLGAAGAVTLMIKFSTGVAAGLIVAGGALSALRTRRRRSALMLGGGFLLGVLAWGVAGLGSAGDLGRFLSVSLRIAGSHNDALQRTGPRWQAWLVVAALCLTAAGITRMLRERKEAPGDLLPLILPACGLFILACKHGFGRQETHVFHAFSIGGVLATWICVEIRDRGGWLARGLCLAGAAALAAGTFILSPPTRVLLLPGVPFSRARELLRSARELRDPDHRSRLRDELRRRLPLGETLQREIAGRTVDVLTTEIAMVEAWEMRWAPRTVLQSYIVSSSILDGMDAGWFSGASAPERLLVDLQGVDTRHPFMDSPLAWRQIFLRYDPLDQDRRWLVLGRRGHPRALVETPLQRFIAPFNQPIPVPKPAAGHLEMQVILKPSLLGRLASMPWVVPEVRVGFVSATRQPLRRILAPTAMNSFPLIDPWPDSPAQLNDVFVDPHPASPQAVGFVTRDPWAWTSEIDVTFIQVEWPAARSDVDAREGRR
jgi:hypothetical protein